MKTLNELTAPNKHPLVKALKNPKSNLRGYYASTTIKKRLQSAGQKELGAGVYGAAYSKGDSVIKVYEDDPAYHAFAKFAKQNHPNDPHLPKIRAVGKIKGTNMGAVRMEKLEPLESSHPARTHDYGVRGYIKDHPTLSKSLQNIRQKFPHEMMDIHSGNVMKRKDGTLVITDPLAPTGQTIKENAPPEDKYERMVKHIKAGYNQDGDLSKKEKSIAYATAWKAYKNKNK